ncbi:MAG: hypothetical protein HN463_14005 [Gemmatimonadales bacterium]|nr:hypothetical protein [Gemmatimonadales bacterium]
MSSATASPAIRLMKGLLTGMIRTKAKGTDALSSVQHPAATSRGQAGRTLGN